MEIAWTVAVFTLDTIVNVLLMQIEDIGVTVDARLFPLMDRFPPHNFKNTAHSIMPNLPKSYGPEIALGPQTGNSRHKKEGKHPPNMACGSHESPIRLEWIGVTVIFNDDLSLHFAPAIRSIVNDSDEIAAATFTNHVKRRKPTEKMPLATSHSFSVGEYS